MWPWGHLAVGYLAYRVLAGIANRWVASENRSELSGSH